MLEENVIDPQGFLQFILQVLSIYAPNFNIIHSLPVKTKHHGCSWWTCLRFILWAQLKPDNLRYFSLDQNGGLTDTVILTATSRADVNAWMTQVAQTHSLLHFKSRVMECGAMTATVYHPLTALCVGAVTLTELLLLVDPEQDVDRFTSLRLLRITLREMSSDALQDRKKKKKHQGNMNLSKSSASFQSTHRTNMRTWIGWRGNGQRTLCLCQYASAFAHPYHIHRDSHSHCCFSKDTCKIRIHSFTNIGRVVRDRHD